VNKLFTDQDAAQVLEELSPEIAASVKRMVNVGTSPEQIYKRLNRQHPNSVVIQVVRQAAHFYQAQRGI